MRAFHRWSLLVAVLAAACGADDSRQDPDAAVDAPSPDAAVLEPTMLSQSGLYSDIANRTLAPGVVEFTPRWHLWSDAADKRRWIYLPPGTQIDTSDMDFWKFPQGTKLWKEFKRDGVVIETRLLQKNGTTDTLTDWYMVSFQWDPQGADAVAVPAGVVDDAGHNDIPSRSDCRKCHTPARNPSVVLGFQALSLDYDGPNNGMDLGQLVAENKLSAPPSSAGMTNTVYFPLPSSGPAEVLPAFGYMHANCGGCHNSRSELTQGDTPQTLLQLRLETAAASRGAWTDTPTWKRTVNITGQLGGTIIAPDSTTNSTLHQRLSSEGAIRMPPVGRETVDTQVGLPAVEAWINSF